MSEIQHVGYEDLTVSTTAVGFTAATFGEADYAMVLVQSAPVRFRFSGTATASSGDTLEIGDRLELDGVDELEHASFISRDGASATLRCSFGKKK
jgi:hypothetical protein